MAHFISLDEVDGLVPIEWDGARVCAQYERLHARLNRSLPESAGLFAEPVWAGGADAADTVSWYTSYEGEPVPLTSLPADEQEQAAGAIRHAVEDLLPLLRDREFGPFLGRCLLLPDLEDVLLVGGRPVLRNWGWILPGHGSGDAGLANAWAAGLGRFLPAGWRPWAMGEPAASAPPPPPLAPARARGPAWWRRPVIALPVMLLLVAASAAGSYVAFRRSFLPLSGAPLVERARLDRRQAILDERIGTFTRALGAGLCTRDGADTAALDDGSAARVLNRAIGRVIVPGMPNPARGTAVFVGQDQMVVPESVLDGVGDRQIFIESLGVGNSFVAERTATPARDGLAVLHLLARARFAIPLRPAAERIPGTPVYAAALPGFINPNDASFLQMRRADLEESPIPLISRLVLGEVQNPPLAVPAPARPPGAEGAALMDACGRLIGVSANAAPAGGLSSGPVAEMLRLPNAPACLALPEFVTAQDRGS